MILLRFQFGATEEIRKGINRGEIDTVVGHSLGGSVSLELQKNYPDRIKKSRTYGAPVMDLLGSESENVDRYRNWLDPVSIFDRGAKKSKMEYFRFWKSYSRLQQYCRQCKDLG